MTNHTRAKRPVKTIDKTLMILETIRDNDGMRLSELANELDMGKSTIHRYLKTLLDAEYIVMDDNHYNVGLQFLELGEHARNRVPGNQLIKQKVSELAEVTEERAQFIVEEHGQAVYLYRESGSHGVQTDPGIAKRIDLHSTAAGKAIMAEWSDEIIDQFVDQWGLPSRTSETITEGDVLMKEIKEIREREYAVNSEENITGLRAVGVAVNGPNDSVIGAFSVSGPLNRMKGDRLYKELPDLLRGISNEIELNLKYS